MKTILFLVTASHSAENYPANDPERIPEVIEGVNRIEPTAGELGIKVHFTVIAGLHHVSYLLVETDTLDALHRLVGAIPFPQNYTVTPVEQMQDAMR